MMFRKLNQWLLTRYPLCWNMRLHIVLPLIVLVHILFYAVGYSSRYSLQTLYKYDHERESIVYMFASLLAILFIALWLVFYLRNNAFKSFYPLRRGRLFAEFILQILILAGVVSFSLSWKKGVRDRILHVTQQVALEKEAETVNLAMHFIPFNKDEFDIINSCDSQIINKRGIMIVNDPNDTVIRPHSYLYYCHNELYYYGMKNDYEVSAVAQRWLKEQKRDSVQQVISAYLQLCRKYGAQYAFDAGRQTAAVFATPDFRVQNYIPDRSYMDSSEVFIEHYYVSAALQRIDRTRNAFLSPDDIIPLLYLSVCAALVLTSFRITKLRTWFIAVIGSGIWAMIFALVAIMAREEEVVMMVYLLLIAAFIIYSSWHVRRRSDKVGAGLSLLWFTWTLPSIVPVLCQGLRYSYYRIIGEVNGVKLSGTFYEMVMYIEDHKELVMFTGLFFTIIITGLVVIPLARKWQANPEE